MNTLEVLKQQVELYKLHRKSYSREQLQDIRDEISTCIFELAEPLADSRFNHERAEFISKLEKSRIEEGIRGSGAKVTREQVINRSRIETATLDEQTIELHREYQVIRGLIEGANNILNSIASRLNRI